MKSILKPLSFLLLFVAFSFSNLGSVSAQVTATKFYLTYNTSMCYYEAHVVITGGSASSTSHRTAGAVQFSIVVPTGTTITKVTDFQPMVGSTPSNWNIPQTRINAPSVTPSVDYIAFTLPLSGPPLYPSVTTGTDILLTTFRLSTNSCGAGIRMWRNNNDDGNPDPIGPNDPSSAASGMLGANFNNSFTIGSTAETYTGNASVGSTTPPSPSVALTPVHVPLVTLAVNSTVTPGSPCRKTMQYAWTGPNSYTSSDSDILVAPLTAAKYGTYTLVVKDSNGCTASASTTIINPLAPPLPVKLLTFDGTANKCAAVLSWTTASENNLQRFDVQHSTGGGEFKTVAQVLSNKNPNGSKYSFIYNQEEKKGYYRLKMVDQDGSFTVSQTISVTTACDNSLITVAPNPTTGPISVRGISTGDQVRVVDVLGQIITSVISTGTSASVDISPYAPGVYAIFVMQDQIVTKTAQVIKR